MKRGSFVIITATSPDPIQKRINVVGASLSEERGILIEVMEPFSLGVGFINRTPRACCATELAFENLGVSQSGGGKAAGAKQSGFFSTSRQTGVAGLPWS